MKPAPTGGVRENSRLLLGRNSAAAGARACPSIDELDGSAGRGSGRTDGQILLDGIRVFKPGRILG